MGTNCKRATRPCKCGYLGHHDGRCRCTPDQVARYRDRISGPLLDRIDLHIDVPVVSESDFLLSPLGETSAAVRERVARARQIQLLRQEVPNARLSGREIEERARPQAEGRQILREASSRLRLSGRSQHRVLKVARTIADLDGSPGVRAVHIAESLRYRSVTTTACTSTPA